MEISRELGAEKAVVDESPTAPPEKSADGNLEGKGDLPNDILNSDGATSSKDSEGISIPPSEHPEEEAAEGCKEANEVLSGISIDPSPPIVTGKKAKKNTEKKKETPGSEKSGSESGEFI